LKKRCVNEITLEEFSEKLFRCQVSAPPVGGEAPSLI
jgi:hypothetical protein